MMASLVYQGTGTDQEIHRSTWHNNARNEVGYWLNGTDLYPVIIIISNEKCVDVHPLAKVALDKFSQRVHPLVLLSL